MGDIADWWNTMPPVTKWLIALNGGITLASSFGILPVDTLTLSYGMIIRRLEIWRLFTSLFVWKLGFHFLIQMFFLFRHGKALEEDDFRARPADFVFMLMVNCVIIWIAAFFLGFPVLSGALVMSILYVWSRRHPDVPMTFMFGFRFQSVYLPWVLLGFSLLMGGNPLPEACGVAAGHSYHFFADIFPRTHGTSFIVTPLWLQRLLPPGPRVVAGVHGPVQQFPPAGQPQQRQGDGGGYDWGQGYHLGQN